MKFIKKIVNKIFIWFRQNFGEEQLVASAPRPRPIFDAGVTVIDLDKETNVLDVDLLDDNASEQDKKTVKQYTKKWVDIILTVSLIDVQMCFILAFLGKDQIAETLGIAIITEIVGISLGYMLKAYFETNAQKKNELEMERIKRTYEVNKPTINENINDEESVG